MMATKSITTVPGQSVYDIALQVYGSIEAIDKVLMAEGLDSINNPISPNLELSFDEVEDNSVNDFFANKRAVATDDSPLFIATEEGEFILTEEGEQMQFI